MNTISQSNSKLESKNNHIFQLSKELLDDIELDRLPAESLLLKSARLARIVNATDIQQWINYELQGYTTETLALEYMTRTGRWKDKENGVGYWIPLAQITGVIEINKQKLQTMQLPNLSGDLIALTMREVLQNRDAISNQVNQLCGIKSRVLALLHNFVSRIYYEKAFSGLAEEIFDKYKANVDDLIASRCGDVLIKLPFIYDRLTECDTESISQALTTCRRVIDSFADTIYPPSEKEIEIEGNILKLSETHHQNRINAYIAHRTDSKSRKKKLRQFLANLYDRVSTGVHNDISFEEAKSLLLSTYLLLGEILTLDNSVVEKGK